MGASLAEAQVSPCPLGQFALRHYRFAPGSDDAVGAGLGCDCAADCSSFDVGSCCLDPQSRPRLRGWLSDIACEPVEVRRARLRAVPDMHLQAFRPPVHWRSDRQAPASAGMGDAVTSINRANTASGIKRFDPAPSSCNLQQQWVLDASLTARRTRMSCQYC